eukprot:gene17938-19729_t
MKTLAIILLVCSFAIFGFAAEEEDIPVEAFDEQAPDESNEQPSNEDSEEDDIELTDESAEPTAGTSDAKPGCIRRRSACRRRTYYYRCWFSTCRRRRRRHSWKK